MRFGDFFRAHVTGGGAAGGDGAGRGYLAQHGLFDQVPSLQADILRPDYCALGEGAVSVRREPNPRRRCRPPLPAPAPEPRRAASLQAVNAWIGGAGTVTPAHTDPEHNLFCQVVGSKYVRLYAPAHTEALYPHPSGLCTNSSQATAPAPAAQALRAMPLHRWRRACPLHCGCVAPRRLTFSRRTATSGSRCSGRRLLWTSRCAEARRSTFPRGGGTSFRRSRPVRPSPSGGPSSRIIERFVSQQLVPGPRSILLLHPRPRRRHSSPAARLRVLRPPFASSSPEDDPPCRRSCSCASNAHVPYPLPTRFSCET